MKSIKFLSIALIFLVACETFEVTKYYSETNMYLIDFSEFAEKGFLFTPLGYEKHYESLGIVSIEEFSEATRVPIPGDNLVTMYTWKFSKVDTKHIVKKAYDMATKLGADALINIQIIPTTKTTTQTVIPGVKFYGFAINRAN